MTAQVDVGLYGELQKFGAADVSACFSCGNVASSVTSGQVAVHVPQEKQAETSAAPNFWSSP